MPSTYAHKRFGELVFDLLPAPLQEQINTHKESFYLGLHGPDILFYYKPTSSSPTKKDGIAIHFAPAKDFFLKAAKKLIAFKNPLSTAEGAYVAGFLCHFGLDDACHGHIYKLEGTGVAHGKIESEFDKLLLRADGKKIRGYNPAGHLTDKNGTSLAAAVILEKDEEILKESIKTIRKINRLFTLPFEPFHWFAHLILNIAGMRKKFGSMFLHLSTDKRCVQTCNILKAQFEKAVQPTAYLIEEYFSNLDSIAKTGEMNKIFDKDFKGDKIL